MEAAFQHNNSPWARLMSLEFHGDVQPITIPGIQKMRRAISKNPGFREIKCLSENDAAQF
jgi:hypothetical protein